MGSRRGGGSLNGDRTLRRCIEAAGKNYPIDELVERLRSLYPRYSRLQVRPFTKHVERVVVSSRTNDSMDTPIVNKKRRKTDGKEEKSQLIEAEASTSESVGLEPEFDLMKSMMQDDLVQKSKKLREGSASKEAMELEMVDNKGVKLNLLTKEPTLGGGNVSSGRDDGNDVNRPMFKHLGGMNRVIEEMKMKVILPLLNPKLVRRLRVKPTAGILLHGPPGCGKTRLALAIANETGLPFYKICATDLVSGVSGGSEQNIRELFSKAHRTKPSIVFIDEIDAIASKRENLQREMERRIVTQLMTCMDSGSSDDCRLGHVLVIGATNRPDAVDPALRRPGRFDREIVLGVPDEAARVEILSVLTSNLELEGAFDLLKIARSTPGFVGADLAALASEASNLALESVIYKRKADMSTGQKKDEYHCEDWWRQQLSDEEMENISITMANFEKAVTMVQPSLTREGFSTIPNVKWDDVGGLHPLRLEFDRYIVRRIKFPKDYEDFGLDLETAFLLYGPPGCGKTLIAKAVANEAGANFIHIKGPEILNKYVGESELAVRTIFDRARKCTPCILFFDEVDALTTERGREGGWVVERLLNQLLIELDGAEQRRGVYVIGATNRPEVMDRALLRPGRFGNLMYVPLPSPEERGMILKALAMNKPIDSDVDLITLGKSSRCDNLSGADLSSLMHRAAMAALEDKLSSSVTSSDVRWTIKDAHFTRALKQISPSVSDKQRHHYKLLSEGFKANVMDGKNQLLEDGGKIGVQSRGI